jgi:hypothetical protein
MPTPQYPGGFPPGAGNVGFGNNNFAPPQQQQPYNSSFSAVPPEQQQQQYPQNPFQPSFGVPVPTSITPPVPDVPTSGGVPDSTKQGQPNENVLRAAGLL